MRENTCKQLREVGRINQKWKGLSVVPSTRKAPEFNNIKTYIVINSVTLMKHILIKKNVNL